MVKDQFFFLCLALRVYVVGDKSVTGEQQLLSIPLVCWSVA